MPRPKRPGGPEPKKRSRNGCWPCKNRKIKCGEEHPDCLNCQRAGEKCDYSIRLNWDGRRGKPSEQGTVLDFSPEIETPTLPASGFKLVHQNPGAGKSAANRKVEPLIPPSLPKKRTKDAGESTRVGADEKAPKSAHKRRKSELKREQPVVESDGLQDPDLHSSTEPGNVNDDVGVGKDLDDQTLISPEAGRVSVDSLLAGPGAVQGIPVEYSGPQTQFEEHPTLKGQLSRSVDGVYYGIDRGLPDLDLGKNDDENAISSGTSPLIPQDEIEALLNGFDEDLFSTEFAFGLETNGNIEQAGGYYESHVLIYIPYNLEPLPPRLLQNPMNLLYFHHFINHTAKVLVPYDDPGTNPFRTTLPQMALSNDNLLSLLLAYSASHRARVLKQPEPSLRIATWVMDTLPALRQALSDPSKNFSDANVATAIMLASLDIASPKTFDYNIPWQKHLNLARELIVARPGGLHYKENFRKNPASSFLWSWAAYMDVIGSLSGGHKDSSTAWMFDYEIEDIVEGLDEIDCVMGFSTRCVYLLAKVADLAQRCDAERRAGQTKTAWRPSDEVVEQARRLEDMLIDSMNTLLRPCKHFHARGDPAKWNHEEVAATNRTYHFAGLIHLYKRILGRPTEDPDVQVAVGEIIACFDHIRRGGPAEKCLLFPIFTAGCDAVEGSQRSFILDRLSAGEDAGMTQVHNARRLMERVWETGQPWETLLSTEFIG